MDRLLSEQSLAQGNGLQVAFTTTIASTTTTGIQSGKWKHHPESRQKGRDVSKNENQVAHLLRFYRLQLKSYKHL